MKTMEDNYMFLINKLSPIMTTYVNKASTNAKYPYSVIKINTMNELNNNFDELFFDIDVWCKNKTANDNGFYEVEKYADLIQNNLKYLRENGYIINQMSRFVVDDEDMIHHRKLKYYAKIASRKY